MNTQHQAQAQAQHQAQQQQNNLSGAHPATVDEVDRRNNLTQTSNPINGVNNNNTSLMNKQAAHTGASAVSSTPSEFGSDNNSRRSSSSSGSSSPRPVADKNAFIPSSQVNQHWQNNMSPAERAKKLGDEMDQTLKERRKSNSSAGSPKNKTLKIAGKKEVNLN